MNKRFINWALIIALLALIGGIVTFLVRGPYMSNYLKKVILRELSSATGKEVLARDIRISFFPLFVVVDGIKVLDEKGQRVATVELAKAYVGLSGLLRKEIEIAPIYLRDVEISADRASFEEISNKFKNYIEKKSKKKTFLKARVKSIEVENTQVSFFDEGAGLSLSLEGSKAVMKFRDLPYVEFSLPKIHIKYKDYPEFEGSGMGSFLVKKDLIELKTLSLKAYGSEFGASGGYSSISNRGSFTLELSLLVESVKEFFGLRNSGQGKITAKGLIEIDRADIGNPSLELSLKGDFRLESLMELLRAKTERELSGYVSFKGNLNGKVRDLRGRASARLKRGKLFDIPVDDLRCNVIYGGGRLEFKDASGRLWGGTTVAGASIHIPHVKPYSLDIEAKGLDSPPILELIGLSSIGLPIGKLDGAIHTEGDEFDPSGWFRYEASVSGDNLIGRIKTIDGAFEKSSNEISLYDIHAQTGYSKAVFSAIINTISKDIRASGDISTSDIRDITEPYFGRLSGEGYMRFSLGGIMNAPEITASIEAGGLAIDSYRIGSASVDAFYREGIIELDAASEDLFEGLRVTHSLKGKILLEKPFDIKNPEYALSLGIKNSDIESLLKTLGIGINLSGRVFSDIEIKGKEPSLSGKLTIARAVIYGFSLDTLSGGFSYKLGEFSLSDGVAKRGDSALNLSGRYSKDGFSLRASSDEVYLRDVFSGLLKPPYPDIDYKVRLSMEGKGTIDEPAIDLIATLTEGSVNGIKSEDGRLEASLRGRDISLNAALFNNLVSMKGSAKLSDEMPWRAEVGLSNGRYDFLLRSFLKNIPSDALIGLEGSAHLSGSRNSFNAEASINRLYMALYEQEFTNDKEIKITVLNKNVSFGEIVMRGQDAFFRVSGGFEFGKDMNISLEGRASLLPFAGGLKVIEIIKGKGDFVLSAKGSWDRPSITGGIEVRGATIGIKGLAQRLTDISGYLYVDEDTITVERLSAKSRGGEIETSGAIYLKGFGIERVYLETLINQVSVELRKGLNVVFGGNIVLKGTPEGLDLTGDVNINRATYKERIEWRTWLISPKKEAVQVAREYLDKVKLNLRVHGSEAITIDNNIARASLKTDLIVRGTLSRPVLYGRIEAKEGRVYFRNNEFSILTATADFSGTRAGPYYVIVAETFSRGYHIWLTLEGEIEKFDLTLHSDPPLDDVSILALLTVGEFGERLSGLEGGIGAAEAASFLTGKYQDIVEERVRNITGFDRVQIDPYVSKTTGSIVPKVTVSKKLIGDRLYVTYSSAIGTGEEQVLKLEYLLSSNISLVGERDERGSIGGDIKLRFKFK